MLSVHRAYSLARPVISRCASAALLAVRSACRAKKWGGWGPQETQTYSGKGRTGGLRGTMSAVARQLDEA